MMLFFYLVLIASSLLLLWRVANQRKSLISELKGSDQVETCDKIYKVFLCVATLALVLTDMAFFPDNRGFARNQKLMLNIISLTIKIWTDF